MTSEKSRDQRPAGQQGGHKAEAVSFDRGLSYRATVDGQLQRPDFNSKGAALAFADAVARGVRKPEPV